MLNINLQMECSSFLNTCRSGSIATFSSSPFWITFIREQFPVKSWNSNHEYQMSSDVSGFHDWKILCFSATLSKNGKVKLLNEWRHEISFNSAWTHRNQEIWKVHWYKKGIELINVKLKKFIQLEINLLALARWNYTYMVCSKNSVLTTWDVFKNQNIL